MCALVGFALEQQMPDLRAIAEGQYELVLASERRECGAAARRLRRCTSVEISSPRRASALPPRAATTRTSISLVERDAVRRHPPSRPGGRRAEGTRIT